MLQPNQLVPLKERDAEYWKSTLNYYIDQTWRNNFAGNYYIDLCYKAVQGEMDLGDYAYVLNPYNTENKSFQKRPAKLRNYNIILPIVSLFMGELNRKNMQPQVIVTNSDAESKYKDSRLQAVMGILAQQFVNHMNSLGIETGVESKETPDLQTTVEKHDQNYNDSRAQFGQEAIDYIRQSSKTDDKVQRAFFHFIVSGRVITYKDVWHNEIVYEVEHPLNVRWYGNPPSRLLEDCDAVVKCNRMTFNAIVGRFHDKLSKETLEKIRVRCAENTGFGTFQSVDSQVDDNWRRENFIYSGTDNSIDVYHACFKTTETYQVLKYKDIFGEEKEIEVGEDYILQPEKGDISLRIDFKDVTYEGWRFDQDIYLDLDDFSESCCRPTQSQRQMVTNKAICKLPYNGTLYSFPSIVYQGLSYQALYNILNFRAELTLARNKDKITLFPIGGIPNKEGWDEDKFIYFAENTGWGFFDESNKDVVQALQGVKVLDLSLSQYVSHMKDLIRGVKDEWWDSIGMNRQRYGDNAASDGKGVTEQAIFRSTVITDELHRQFRYFIESEYQGLLDISKIAWQDGLKTSFVRSDGSIAFFSVEPTEHIESDYGVFCVIDEKEEVRLKKLEALAQPFAQNSVSAPIVADMISTNNTAKARQLLRKGWELQQAFEEKAQKSQQESAERISQNQLEAKKIEDERERYKIDETNKKDITVALIQAQGKAASGMGAEDFNVEGFIDDLSVDIEELNKLSMDARKEALQKRTQESNLANQSRNLSDKQRLKEIDLQIAKENKNKFDK